MTLTSVQMLDLVMIPGVVVLTLAVLMGMQRRHRRMMLLRYHLLDPKAQMPLRGSAQAAGMDFFLKEQVVLLPGEPYKIATGVATEIPEGHFGMIRSRSSAFKKGIIVQGTVDADYRGEIFVVATNLTNGPITLEAGIAIAQMILVPYISPPSLAVTVLSKTERQAGGFGSTGSNV